MEEQKLVQANIEDEMRRSYLDYAMSVIIGRALPDVRDGFKPVHRRVLWTMNELSNTFNKPYKKSARVVGDCFVKGELVHTDSGLTPIEKLEVGSHVRLADGKTSKIVAAFHNPPSEVVDVALSNGHVMTVTSGQLFRILNDDLSIAWERAENLSGKRVLASSPISFGTVSSHPDSRLNARAYSAGLFVAEGFLTDRGRSARVGIQMTDIEPLNFIAEHFVEAGVNVRRFTRKPQKSHWKPQFGVRLSGVSDLFDLCENKCDQKEVPTWVLADRRLFPSFVAGFIDGDGFIRSNGGKREVVLPSTSRTLITQIQAMLADFGIHGVITTPEKSMVGKQVKPQYILTITGEPASHLCRLTSDFLRIPRKHDSAVEARDWNRRVLNTETTCIPSREVFEELSRHHIGSDWFLDAEGRKFRAGIKYPDGTKIRYASNLRESSLSFRQLKTLGILEKLGRIGSPLALSLRQLAETYSILNVVSVSRRPEAMETYDIQIAHESHEFFVHGCAVHNCIGKYHPHGDTAVYDTIVRMAQDFSMRMPLVDGQGNFGSVDGDAPAAMRYTEVRLARISDAMLTDIDKETVDFQENYDGSQQEPVVLPARFPNLLVNGSAGIAVGMATNIPPHNLTEIVEATIHLVQKPTATVEDLMKYVQGPDFPTSGFICGRKGIRDAYTTGRGSITMRARAAIDYVGKNGGERQAIVVTELPYQVNKAKLIEKIAELVNEKRIEDISDLRDESDREGMRIVIELKRGAVAQVVLNNLYKLTPMQTNFGIINLSIVNGQPRILNLLETLYYFIEHRKDVVRRRTQFELRKAEARAHILEGLKKALDIMDAVIKLIRASKSGPEAREGLMTQFQFSQIQAQAILEMQLQKLTNLERQKIVDEYEAIIKRIAELKEILENESVLRSVIVKELQEVKKEFGEPRRTLIVDEETELTIEDLIPDEEVVITITRGGYIKRTPVSAYRTQRRGGTGRRGMATKAEDVVDSLYTASTHSFLMIFTTKGQVYKVKVHEIPDAATAGRGKAIVNLVELPDGESVAGTFPVREFTEGRFVVMVTRKGTIKKTELSEYANIRSNGIIAMGIDDDDELIEVQMSDGKKKILISTFDGQAICFEETDVRPMGRPAYGVIGIKLREGDYVTGVCVVDGDEHVLAISELGLGKRTKISEYPVQGRGGVGVINMKVTDRTGGVVKALMVKDDDQMVLITKNGQLVRVDVKPVRETGRAAQGVKLINLSDGDLVVAASLVEGTEEE